MRGSDTALAARAASGASASYRKFTTPEQFAAAYGLTPVAVAQVVAFLQAQGFTVDRVHGNRLLIDITGTNAQFAATFGAPMHTWSLQGETWTAPAADAVLPASLKGLATGIAGLSTRPSARRHQAGIPQAGALADDLPAAVRPAGTLPASGPGTYTVKDTAARYNVNPLYAKGLTGAGRTIGILAMGAYDPADVFAYWNALGLAVDAHRITNVLVAGGASPRSGLGSNDAAEATLDIQQAGGLAPGAAMRVYIGPVTEAGMLALFSTAVTENKADVLSISWGEPESHTDAYFRTALHAVFLQAAAQGIPLVAASGDNGAFDTSANYPFPDCTTMLSVDFPAADPQVLAAGGTTLPHTMQHKYGVVSVPSERPWGWDYLRNYVVTWFGSATYYADYYTHGGGGGVSTSYALPAFQSGLAGTATSAPAQTLICSSTFLYGSGTGYQAIASLSGNYAGRNLPDVSLDADPYTGYSVFFNAGWFTGVGGTSFVAPQLNGMLTLISSGLPGTGRLGAINPQLYAAFQAKGYGAGSPFTPIAAGDNEYYKAAAHYNPATGLGSLNVDALAGVLGVH